MHETKSDQDLQKQYDEDLRDMVQAFRTLKDLSKWLPWILATLIAITVLILNFRKIMRGGE